MFSIACVCFFLMADDKFEPFCFFPTGDEARFFLEPRREPDRIEI